MVDSISGLVVAVSQSPVGTQTAAITEPGSSVLLLDDTIDMNPTGGQVTINGVVTAYTESNDDESTITLAEPWLSYLDAGAEVLVYPPQVEMTALTLIDGASDPIPAEVPWDKQDALPVGIREEEDRERVRLTRSGEWSWSVADLPGSQLSRSGELLTDGTVPGQAVWNPHAMRALNLRTIPTGTGSGPTTITSYTDVELVGFNSTASTVTVVEPGWYAVQARVTWEANASGRRFAFILLNGEIVTRRGEESEGGTALTTVEVSTLKRLAAGDVLSMGVSQSSGSSIAIRSSENWSHFAAYRISV